VRAIQKAIEEAKRMFATLKSGRLEVTLLSSLAEGADRLVALEVLKVPGSILEVVLPLEREDYMQDFESVESKREFEELFSCARSVRRVAQKHSRNEAYEQAGRYIVDHCDVLIALWDGKPAAGQGGTAEIVEYARKKNRPLIWIHTEDPVQVTIELRRT